MNPTPDVVVVGGGLVGCLAARGAAADGRTTLVVERASRLGRESSWAAAGLLSPQMEAVEEILVTAGPDEEGRREAMLALCIAARARYRAFVRDIEAETGASVHYRAEGTLLVAASPAEASVLSARGEAQRARGLRAEWLEPDAAHALEPALTPEIAGALHLPDDHSVDNVALVQAAAASLTAAAKVRIWTGASVERVIVESGRVAGIVVDGERVAAGAVVLAAGAWSSAVEGVPGRVPVRPVKGQMAALQPRAPIIRNTVGGRGVYCVPRDDGRVLVGATVEDAGFDKTVNAAAIDSLVTAAASVVPALAAASVVARWAGLRPGTADDLPVLGPDPEIEGLLWATGHYRNGILLAPITAEIVAAHLRGDPPPVDIAAFAPGRAR